MTTPSLDIPRIQSRLLQLHDAKDLSKFWDALQSIFRTIMPDDALTVYLNYFDFTKSWKATTIFSTPDMVKSAEWHDQRRRVEVTTPFINQHPEVRLYRLSDIFSSHREFQGSTLFQDFMKPYGWRDSVGLVYRHGNSVNSVIALRRPANCGDYLPEELRLLKKLHPHIKFVIKRILATSEERARLVWLERASEHLPYALLRLNWELEATYANREAMKQCCAWNFGPDRAALFNLRAAFKIPEPVLDACEQLKLCWLRQLSDHPDGRASLSAKVGHLAHAAMTATVTLQGGDEMEAARPTFAIWFENRGSSGRAQDRLPSLPEVDSLTTAERELVTLIGRGCSNKEAAAMLGKSRKTVAGQLTSIYKKLGVTGRTRMIASLQ